MKTPPPDETTLARIRRALASHDPVERAEAVGALGILGDAHGLADALAHDDAYVRRTAVRELADVPGERTTWRLSHMIFDPDDEVRCAVVRALARRRGICGWLVAHALRRAALQDDSPRVRFLALTSLAEIGAGSVVEVLRTALTDDPESLVRDTARALLARRGVLPDPTDDETNGAGGDGGRS